jgi:hypothetical protein
LRSYVARVTSTPPVVDFLPTRTKLLPWMQSLTGPLYAFGPVVGQGFGFVAPAAPPMPGPWMRTKLVLNGLPVTACGVTPSPT